MFKKFTTHGGSSADICQGMLKMTGPVSGSGSNPLLDSEIEGRYYPA